MNTTFNEQLMPPSLLAQEFRDKFHQSRINEIALKEQMIYKRILCIGGALILSLSIYFIIENQIKKEKEI